MSEDEARALALALIPQSSRPMSLSELENYLAAAADLLRGSVDQADFKAYIFPLMFFKRISDVYLEEFEGALVESGGDHEYAAFAENHRFAIPGGNLWSDVREKTENIGARRLYTVMERLLEEVSFSAGSKGCEAIRIDAEYVDSRLTELAKNEDLSRFVL